jgi:uncharacterized protein (DUF2062 family)
MGWRRAWVYTRHRLVRLKDSNHAIATGLALGAAVSFTPMPGMHILQALGFTWLARGNLLAAFIGTLVGNPWTIPLMWWSSYKVGKWAFEAMGFEVRSMPGEFTWGHLVSEITADPLGLILPWILGGYVMLLLSFPVFYALFYWMMVHIRSRHIGWKQRRIHEAGQTITDRA